MNFLFRRLQKHHIRYGLVVICLMLICGFTGFSCRSDNNDARNLPEILPYRDILRQCGEANACDVQEPDVMLYKEGRLELPASHSFVYYTRPHSASLLQVKLNALPRKIQALIHIEADDIESETFTLKNRKEHRFDLSRFSGKAIKITFAARSLSSEASTGDARVEWAAARLALSPEKENQGTPGTPLPLQSDAQTVLQKLRTYDVIYLVFDAFHAKHSNVYGYPKETTPFLSQLSQEAFVFEHMFANAPYTLASTASLFTSKYPFEHGLTSMKRQLSKILPTLSELLTDSAIETCLIANHGFLGKEWGLQRGFSTLFHGPRYGRYPKHIIAALETIYAQHAGKRKFIYIHCGPPHFPYNPPERFRKGIPENDDGLLQPTKKILQDIDSGVLQVDEKQMAYIRSFYDANILFADDIARQIVTYLREQGHLSKSVLMISSDHGEAFFQHQRMLHSTTVYDEMIHVPFVLRIPEELTIPPRRITHISSLIDVAPTLADIFSLADDVDFSGKSLLPTIFYDLPVNDVVYASTSQGMTMIRDLAYKYLVTKGEQTLFDIHQNPEEQDNIINQKPITAAYYHQRLRSFSSENGSEMSHLVVDQGLLPPETVENLRELGYIN